MDDHVTTEAAYTTDHGGTEAAEPSGYSPTSVKRELRRMLVSVSESIADRVNPRTVLTIQQAIILIGLILLVTVVLQIPTILYYANPPSLPTRASFISDISVDTCSVS